MFSHEPHSLKVEIVFPLRLGAVLSLISPDPFIPLGKALDGVLQGDGCLSWQPSEAAASEPVSC